ncbi:MAG: class I SAM-dependent methyltransferase [Verrucomicrobiae bacterium]|nr:class I SAM-dependent methyltransferase [Verrucomicrobiae bacterium]MDW8344797.1 methyltransferase domain-containing protein [Verrucomicrobiae bacterium]
MRATPASYWDAVADDWQSARDRLWRQHSDAVNRALLARWMPSGTRGRWLKTDLFDEAVCDGVAETLSEHAAQVVGMDIAVRVLHRARVAGWHRVAADARILPFRSESFDGVVSLSTLDHFTSREDIARALAEVHRVVRPGGWLILTLDNLLNPKIALRSILPWDWLRAMGLVPYQVGATCGPRTLAQVVRAVGFELVEMTAIQHGPRVLGVWLARRLASASTTWQRRYRQWFGKWERLERWPSRYFTGHFVAVRARKR